MGNCPQCSIGDAEKSLDPECHGKRMWTSFLCSSFVLFIVGWILIILSEKIQFISHQWFTRRSARKNRLIEQQKYPNNLSIENRFNCLPEMKKSLKNIISGKTKIGKTFVTIICFCSIASLYLYCIDTKSNQYMETCTSFNKSINMQIDVGLNVVFLIYFLVRFGAAQNKRRFWFSLNSLVDMFTIPPSFLSAFLNRTWTGFRFLRVIPIIYLPDILQYMNVIERPRTIRLIQLASKFIALWFAAAGFLHLVENSGDFFCDFCNAQQLDIFNSVYFIIISMATVGYGDIACKTFVGKSFILIALIGGLAVFAAMVPEFANLFGTQSSYSGNYQIMKGKRHVIVCGHITHHSLTAFLRDFLHKGRNEADQIDVLIIDRQTPDIELEALLKRYYTKLQYFIGSVMNITDLQRIQADKAAACLIIANKECSDSESDDSANLMRVISLKNFNPRIRILLQLLRYHNKLNVVSIPGWNIENDEIICITELKLGLIGMSCVVPGFATMMTNIFRMSSDETRIPHKMNQSWSWRDLYHRGAGMELYLEELPRSFYGKTFAECALICFKLRVMLLAVEMERIDDHGNGRMVVDIIPCDTCVILPGSRAFMVCMSSEDANRVKHYCSICYPVLDKLTESQLKNMRKCSHTKSNDEYSICLDSNDAIVEISDVDTIRLIPSEEKGICSLCRKRSKLLSEEIISSFDSTGMFYFTSPRKIEDAILDTNRLREYHHHIKNSDIEQERTSLKHPLHFRDHIIVCIHADKSSVLIGLRNFVMPLRASSFTRQELPTIIFVTDVSHIEKEWDKLSTFPQIYILNGSPNNPYHLKLISIDHCRQCVIMSASDRGNLDSHLVDKSSVLCALSIRRIEMKRAGLFSQRNAGRKSKVEQNMTENELMRQNRIYTLTTLTIDSNVQYVEQGHTDEVDLEFFLTTPFASGTAFADSVLDCILSCAYYNPNAVNLLRNILVGGIDSQLEEILAEGKPLEQCQSSEILQKRKRARITLVPIHDLIPNIDIRIRSDPLTFSGLFIESLECRGVIVMGIYRLLNLLIEKDPHVKCNPSSDDQKRIVIYYPPYDYQMDSSDMVYMMQHSHFKDD